MSFNQENENAVLSILINNPEMVYSTTNLKAFMFSSSPYQIIYSVMWELVDNGAIPEKTLLVSYLETAGKLINAGGEAVINYLASLDYDKDNLGEYVNQIILNYKAVVLINKLQESHNTLIQNTNAVNDVIYDLNSTIDILNESGDGRGVEQLGSFIKQGWEHILEKVNNPGISGISTGITSIDVATDGIGKEQLWLIAARPGMGKTQTILNMVKNMAERGHSILFSSLEMPKQKLYERLLGIMSGISTTDIGMGLLNKEQLDKLKEVSHKLKDLPIFVDDYYNVNLNYIEGIIRQYHKSHGIDVYVLDYIQLLSERSDMQVHELGQISRKFKLLSRNLDICTIAVSQLNRACEARTDKRPMLSDLKQSGNLEDDADLVAFLYRDDYYTPDANKGMMEFIIRKSRYGMVGTVALKYDPATSQIGDF